MTSSTARANAKRSKTDESKWPKEAIQFSERNDRQLLRFDLSRMQEHNRGVEEIPGQVYSAHVVLTGLEIEFVFHGFEDVQLLLQLRESLLGDLENSVLCMAMQRALQAASKFYCDIAVRGEEAVCSEFEKGTWSVEEEPGAVQ